MRHCLLHSKFRGYDPMPVGSVKQPKNLHTLKKRFRPQPEEDMLHCNKKNVAMQHKLHYMRSKLQKCGD